MSYADKLKVTDMLPPLPRCVGRKFGPHNDINGIPLSYVVEDEIVRIQSDYPEKAIYLQKLRFENEERTELRLAYYIIAKKPRMAGKWAWGQSATMMPIEDFRAIVREARKKGWC